MIWTIATMKRDHGQWRWGVISSFCKLYIKGRLLVSHKQSIRTIQFGVKNIHLKEQNDKTCPIFPIYKL